MRERRPRGFTLVELLVVICIISILLSLVFAIVAAAMNHANKALSQAMVGTVQGALQSYQQTYQSYPWLKATEVEKKMLAGEAGEVEIDTAKVYAELSGRGPVNTNEDFLRGLHGRFKKDLGGGRSLVDAWGREIRIRVDPNNSEVVVWSFGRNGKDETNDGATPDANKQPKIYYLFTSGDSGDDKGTR